MTALLAGPAVARPTGRRQRRRPGRLGTGRTIGLVLAVLWSIVPIYWAIKTSLQTEADARSTDTQYVPLSPTLKNYANLLTADSDVPAQIRRSAINIVVECGAATIVTVLLATLAAYAFARLQFRGRNPIYSVLH